MVREKLFRGSEISFKDVDTAGRMVSGYFANFGTKDWHGDVIQPGAFTKTVSERGPKGKNLIKYLLDHDGTKAIGVFTELEEDTTGLRYTAKVGRHTLGNDFLAMVEDGIINQHSFGYHVVKGEYDKVADVYRLNELFMYEGSPIQFLGANENTPITGLKSFESYIEQLDRLEKFVQNTKASDETILKLYEKINSLQKELEPLTHSKEDLKPTEKQIKESLLNSFDKWKPKK